MMLRCRRLLWGSVLGLLACANGPEIAPQTAQSQSIGSGVARIQREAQAVRPLVRSGWANEYLDATARLSGLAPRKIGALSVDEVGFYYGDGDSPAFFARLLDLFGENDTRHLISRRFLEIDYSAIGTLRILATAGALAAGVSAAPRLHALYSFPGDQGDVPLYGRAELGRVTLIHGQFPSDATTVQTVGGGYDAVVVKNLLKRGLVHPTDPTNSTARVNFGVSDAVYLDYLFKLLRPGGRLLAYNLCPPPPSSSSQPYDPNSDCRSAFSQAQWQEAGFRVRDYDRIDTPVARSFGQVLGMPADQHAYFVFVERP